MPKNLLVIGGNGYIGSRLIYDLQYNYSIESVDICWFGKNLDQSIVQDYRTLHKEYIKRFDGIVLLAGHSSVKMCDGPIVASVNNNINNFIDLISKIDKKQILIYASSGSVYGNDKIVQVEDADLRARPVNNYDITKYTLDMSALRFIKDGYTIIGFRFGTVNGWSPNVREDLMINSMTKKSIETNIIVVNNKNILRPILGISDVSRAVDSVIQNPVPGIYNLASFYDTVDNISHKVGYLTRAQIQELPDIAGVYDFLMNTDKFCTQFNFKFTETIESIVSELINKQEHATFSNRNRFVDYE